MATKLTSAVKLSRRLTIAASKKAKRLAKTKVRNAIRVYNAENRLEKAQEGLKKAQERLEAAKGKLERVKEVQAIQTQQQTDDYCQAESLAFKTSSVVCGLFMERPKAALTTGGNIETEGGETHPISRAAAQAIKATVGRRKTGVISEESAKAVFDALDTRGDGISADVGDVCIVRLRGHKAPIGLSVESGGLRYETLQLAAT